MFHRFSFAVATTLVVAGSAAFAETPPTPSPMKYVMAAGQGDEFEIQEANIAEQRSTSEPIKKLAATMIKDHTKSTELVKDAAEKSGMPAMPPPPMTNAQKQDIAALEAASPADFDGLYIRQQDRAHDNALQLQEIYASSGTDKNLQAAAAKIVPVVQEHVSMIASLKAAQ